MDYGQPIYPTEPTGANVQPTGMNVQNVPQMPIASGNGDIILVPTSRKSSKRWLLMLGAVSFFIAAVALAILAFLPKGGETENVSTDQGVYALMQESYTDVTNIQEMFIRLRGGNYSARGMFTENARDSVNEMEEKMVNFYQSVARIDTRKISVEQARENIEKLKTYLNQVVPAYTETVALYNQYYESVVSGEVDGETVTVQDIFAVYTNTEEFTSVYLYEIMGDLIAELQDYEEVE